MKMTCNLEEFINNFVIANSLIRLWTKDSNGGHAMIYREDEKKPGNISEVCMEWEIVKDKVWQSQYKHCKVIGVNDIVCDGFYREAINIVIEVN